jgi:hypothetical protein
MRHGTSTRNHGIRRRMRIAAVAAGALLLASACATTETARRRGNAGIDDVEQTYPGPRDSQAVGPGALGTRGGSGESGGAGPGR